MLSHYFICIFRVQNWCLCLGEPKRKRFKRKLNILMKYSFWILTVGCFMPYTRDWIHSITRIKYFNIHTLFEKIDPWVACYLGFVLVLNCLYYPLMSLPEHLNTHEQEQMNQFGHLHWQAIGSVDLSGDSSGRGGRVNQTTRTILFTVRWTARQRTLCFC